MREFDIIAGDLIVCQCVKVSFTARKIPQGFVDNRRFQAKAVWLGEEAYPKYIVPPPASKLDEYLEVALLGDKNPLKF